LSFHVPDASGWFEYEIESLSTLLRAVALYRADKDKFRDEGYYITCKCYRQIMRIGSLTEE
jgi:hypothetical protein